MPSPPVNRAALALLAAVPAERRGRTRSLDVSQRGHGHHFQGGLTNGPEFTVYLKIENVHVHWVAPPIANRIVYC